jgi:hypothetical protein
VSKSRQQPLIRRQRVASTDASTQSLHARKLKELASGEVEALLATGAAPGAPKLKELASDVAAALLATAAAAGARKLKELAGGEVAALLATAAAAGAPKLKELASGVAAALLATGAAAGAPKLTESSTPGRSHAHRARTVRDWLHGGTRERAVRRFASRGWGPATRSGISGLALLGYD